MKTCPNLTSKILQADRQAFNIFVEQVKPYALRGLRKWNTERELAKDIYQQSCLILWEKVNRPQGLTLTCDIKTYFMGVCYIQHKRFMEENIRHNQKVNYFITVEQTEYIDDILAYLDIAKESLSPKQRDLIHFCFYDNLSMDEIAKRLSLSNANVAKTTKFKTILKLKKIVKEILKPTDIDVLTIAA